MSFRVEPGWLRSQRVVGRENIHAASVVQLHGGCKIPGARKLLDSKG